MDKKRSRQQVEEDLNLRAWKDGAFKKKLLSHPTEALKEMGIQIPSHVKIHVHMEDGDTWHIIVKKAPPNAKNLSDQELRNLHAAAEDCGGEIRIVRVCGSHS